MEQLAIVTRSNYVESIHYGYVCVVDNTGKVLFNLGDINTKIYFRSTAKPIQTIPVIKSGAYEHYGLNKKQVAVMCSSHSGQVMHQDAVVEILSKVGEETDSLRCGVALPYSEDELKRLNETKEKASVLHSTCSGKHAGMIALAKYEGQDINSYEQIKHYVQQQILSTISYFSYYDRDNISVGVDGCGTQIYLLPIYNVALSYARLMESAVNEDDEYHKASNIVVSSMIEYPEMVAGDKEFCTELMQAASGKLIAKIGAEAVYCVGTKDKKLGICVKIVDGNERAIYPVVVDILRKLNALNDEELQKLNKWANVKIKNNLNNTIGNVCSVNILNDYNYQLGEKV